MNQRTWDATYPGGAWMDEYGNYWSKEVGGCQYRDINEYNENAEGYTPFGDE